MPSPILRTVQRHQPHYPPGYGPYHLDLFTHMLPRLAVNGQLRISSISTRPPEALIALGLFADSNYLASLPINAHHHARQMARKMRKSQWRTMGPQGYKPVLEGGGGSGIA